jgi:hypothetical protein
MNLWYYAFKVALTTGLVILVSESAKRSTLLGGLLASVPVVSVLAIVWLFIETRDATQVAALSKSIFWLVLPSLVLFLLLPVLLTRGLHFYWSLAAAIGATVVAYYIMIAVAHEFGVRF